MSSWNQIQLREYLNTNCHIHFELLITAVSYENRGLESVRQLLLHFQIDKTILISFGTKYLSEELSSKWMEQKEKLKLLFREYGVDYELYECNLTNYYQFKEKYSFKYENTIINITTFPKNWILMLSKQYDDASNIFFYLLDSSRMPTEEELDIGLKEIVVVDGFEGEISIATDVLLVLILGYEGHRTISFLSNFPCDKILPILSIPIKGNEDEDKKYYDNVHTCNWDLLNKNSVIRKRDSKFHTISSLNHVEFYHQLKQIIETYKSEGMDVCISPLGTKVQTLGLYLYCRKHPETQIVYSIPIKRVDITENVDNCNIDDLINKCFIFKLPQGI
jgi:hypothetical protein